ncbi:MAG: oligosaccharide flippase family protein [Bacteroidota bacterium]
MNREFLLNIFFLITINLLIKPFFIFGIDRTVQNTVGAQEYGIYFVLLNFTYLFQIINDFGIQNFNNRKISQYSQLLDKYFPNILILKSLLATAYLGVIFAFGYWAGYSQQYFQLLLFIAFNQVLVSFIFYLRSNISGLAMYRIDSLISAFDKLLMIIFCSVLLWTPLLSGEFRIEYFVFAQSLSLALTALIAFIIVRKRIKRLQFVFNKPFLISILRESAPYALVIFLMTVYTRIDGVMIERLLDNGKYEAGVYASAYRLLDASNMIGFLFAGLLLPMFARMIKQGDSILALLRQSFQMIWTGAITLAIATYCFRTEIMLLLYTEADPYWGEVLGMLMFSFIAVSGTYIYGTLLTANGSMRKMNIIFIISVGLNVVLNYFFILQYQALGAATVTLLTQFFALFAQMWLASREFRLPFNFRLLLRILFFAGLLSALAYGLKQSPLDWRLSFVGLGATGLLLAMLLKMIDLSALIGWISARKQ